MTATDKSFDEALNSTDHLVEDTPTDDVPALEINAVSVSYGNTDVLSDVSLEVDPGEFLGIIGPNGGGKSTLLKVILGLLKPNSGTVNVFGNPPDRARQFIGYVPQHSKFDPRFPIRVWDVVLMGRLGKRNARPFYQRSFYSAEDKQIALDSLEQVDLADYRDRQISQLSGGQQQRVFIARALAMQPRIMLLDEPTASVDKRMESGIFDLLQRLNEQMTIILVTHDVGVLSTYVKSVGCLNRKFVYHGTREITGEMLEATYECPVDLIAHGVPHRVFHHPDEQGEGK